MGRRMDGGDCRDGGGGCKDAGSEDYENLPPSASVSTHMTAGAMAGILEHSIMYPVDSVKVRRGDTLGKEPAEQELACVRLHPVHSTSKPRCPRAPVGWPGSLPGLQGAHCSASSAARGVPRGSRRPREGAAAGAPQRACPVPEDKWRAPLAPVVATTGLQERWSLWLCTAGTAQTMRGGPGRPHVRGFRGRSRRGNTNHWWRRNVVPAGSRALWPQRVPVASSIVWGTSR